MSVLKPPAWTAPKLDAQRPNAPKSTRPRTPRGKANSRRNGLGTGGCSRLDQHLLLKLIDGPPGAVGRMAQAALIRDRAAHSWFAKFVQVFRRPGMEVILALRRFQGEEGFKKIVFLYERSRYLYENKEGHVQNEAKTKLKTRSFLVRRAHADPKVACFLTKRSQKNLAQGRISRIHSLRASALGRSTWCRLNGRMTKAGHGSRSKRAAARHIAWSLGYLSGHYPLRSASNGEGATAAP